MNSACLHPASLDVEVKRYKIGRIEGTKILNPRVRDGGEKMFKTKWLTVMGMIISLLVCMITGDPAVAAPFYEGKTLTVVIGTSPGGTGDFRARAVSQFLQKHLSGSPSIVYKYIRNPIHAANHVANVAKRNGLTIIFVSPGLYSNAILGTRGVRYQAEDYIPLGSPYPGGPYLLVTRPDLHLDNVEKLRAYKGLRFAQRSVGSSMYNLDRLMAFVLDLPEPRWILGYSSPEVPAALERKEADAQTTTLPGFVRDRKHWLKEGFAVPVVMKNTKGRGTEVEPTFPQDREAVDQFADTKLKREILKFHNAMRPSGMLMLAPKGIPEPALMDLRTALQKTWDDPAFAKAYNKLTGETADPMVGKEIEANLRRIPKDPKVMATYKKIISAGPIPPSQ